jgi:hypothetical protein
VSANSTNILELWGVFLQLQKFGGDRRADRRKRGSGREERRKRRRREEGGRRKEEKRIEVEGKTREPRPTEDAT